jgi:transposase
MDMAQPIAPDYGQQFLFPPALEDWVPLDHPARFLREFVDQLDLPALGFVIASGSEGRPPYAPSLLLKIWLYGYFHRPFHPQAGSSLPRASLADLAHRFDCP